MADVPGLLEGASEGVGLGHEFLAHLERARLLIHLVEACDDAEPTCSVDATPINRELALHGGGLAERPQIFVLSKIDLIDAVPPRVAGRARCGAELACSSATGEGIDRLDRAAVRARAGAAGAARSCRPRRPELADFLVYRPAPPARREYKILRDAGTLRVAGRGIERLASPAGAGRRQAGVAGLAAELERLGVESALRAAGAKPGDEILLGAHSFTLRAGRQPEPA